MLVTSGPELFQLGLSAEEEKEDSRTSASSRRSYQSNTACCMSSSHRSHIAAPLTEEEIESRAQALASAVQGDFEDLVRLSTAEQRRSVRLHRYNTLEPPWLFLSRQMEQDMLDSDGGYPGESMVWLVRVQRELPPGNVESRDLLHIFAVLQYIQQEYRAMYKDSTDGETLSAKRLKDAQSAAVRRVLVSPLSVPPSTPVV